MEIMNTQIDGLKQTMDLISADIELLEKQKSIEGLSKIYRNIKKKLYCLSEDAERSGDFTELVLRTLITDYRPRL